jgi:galactokinase
MTKSDDVTADAPGRVNLIGEHTDYHDGYVLPTVIPQRTRVRLRRRSDRRVRSRSAAMADGWIEYELGLEARGRGWLDYVQGVTAVAASSGLRIGGFEADIESTIPLGAGVSSSAALEVALLRALRALFALELDDVRLARLAQAVETTFVGAPVGIMDQMASSLGRDGEALFLDTRTLAAEPVPLPRTIDIVVIDSGVPHAHAGGQYAARRKESFEAAALLGVERLRDVGVGALPMIEALPPVLARRARHVVTENQRVLDAVDAIRHGNAARVGALFAASHASMRDDYETSTPDVDALVAIGARHPDVYGARLTGGGFGGAVVMVAKASRGRDAAESIRDAYARETGREGVVLIPPRSGPQSRT